MLLHIMYYNVLLLSRMFWKRPNKPAGRFQRTQLKNAYRARKDKEQGEELAQFRKTLEHITKKNDSLLSKKPSVSKSDPPLSRPKDTNHSAASGNSDDGDVWNPNFDLEE